MSDNIEQLKPTGFGQYEGVAADLLRFVVVFLHAAFEDIARSLIHQPKNKPSPLRAVPTGSDHPVGTSAAGGRMAGETSLN